MCACVFTICVCFTFYCLFSTTQTLLCLCRPVTFVETTSILWTAFRPAVYVFHSVTCRHLKKPTTLFNSSNIATPNPEPYTRCLMSHTILQDQWVRRCVFAIVIDNVIGVCFKLDFLINVKLLCRHIQAATLTSVFYR